VNNTGAATTGVRAVGKTPRVENPSQNSNGKPPIPSRGSTSGNTASDNVTPPPRPASGPPPRPNSGAPKPPAR